MMDAYSRLFARDRRPIAIFVILMSLVASFGLTRLRFDDEPRGIFASDAENYAELQRMQAAFGSDDNDVILVCEAEDWLQAEALQQLSELAQACALQPGIQSLTWIGGLPVFEPGKLPRLLLSSPNDRLLLGEHPLVNGRLLSSDGRVALIIARIDEEIQKVDGIGEVVGALRRVASQAALNPGLQVAVTGIPPIRVDVFRRIHRDQLLFTALGGVLCALLALCLFRSLGAVLATTLPALIGALWAMGFIGLIGYEINLMSAVLQMLVIVIGLTDSIHLVMDMRVGRARGELPVPAAADAIRRLGLPCFLTSITTAIGFGSLALAGVPIIRDFGAVASVGILLSFLAIITSMPLIASCLPNIGRSAEIGTGSGLRGLGERTVARALGLVLAFPRLIVAIAVLLITGLLGLALRLQPENRLTEALPKGEALDALLLCERAFGGVLPNYVVLQWGPELALESDEVVACLTDVEQLLGGLPLLAKPLSCLDIFDALPGGRENLGARALIPEALMRRFVRPDLRQALVIASVADGPSEVLQPLYASIQAGLAELRLSHPAIGLHLTGTDFVARSNVNGMILDLSISLAFAALVIFGVIALEFRSLRLGLISLLPNLFPLALVGAALQLFGLPLQMSSAILFTILLGLAVDDTIHFLSRYRYERARSAAAREAVQRAAFSVGRAIVITTLVLMLGFGCLAFSTIPLNKLFAALAALGLVGALFGDLVFLPALLLLFDREANRGDEADAKAIL